MINFEIFTHLVYKTVTKPIFFLLKPNASTCVDLTLLMLQSSLVHINHVSNTALTSKLLL